jgi:hypothetical protein
MKKNNFIILLFLISLSTFSQNNFSTNNKKNSISIEFYKPIEKSFNELSFDYGFGASIIGINNYSKKGISNSLGICYERVTNKNIVFRPRIGLSIIKINEEQYSDSEDANQTINFSKYDFDQKNINIFIGIAKRIELTKKISLDFGLDLASIYYLRGKGNFSRTQTQVNLETSENYRDEFFVNSETGNSLSFGIGPYIKPEISIFDDFTLSLEMQVFFVRTISDDESYLIETVDRYLNDEIFEHSELKRIVNNNSKFWEWTKVSPLIRLGYRF